MNTKLRDKIRALRAKTTANGCTEAEALSAAELARKLMAEHRIDKQDLGMAEAREACAVAPPPWHAAIITAVACCTNTAPMLDRRARVEEIVFVGLDPGPEIALYLRDLAVLAVDSAFAEFRRTSPLATNRLWVLRDRAERDFTHHCSVRIAERLLDVFAPQRDDVVLSRALAVRDLAYPASSFIAPHRHRTRDDSAALAGMRAADAVGLHHGVGTPAKQALQHKSAR